MFNRLAIYWEGGSKTFVFRAKTLTDLNEWVAEITYSIKKNYGKNWPVPSVPRFWKFPLLPEAIFRRKADTGDLLLFSGTRFACKVQRFLTRSRFDHVAMLLRYENGKVYVLESTNGDGVGVFEWNDKNMKDYENSYQRVVFRHLKFKRTVSAITRLQNFLNKARGKKYNLDPWRLLKKYSSNDSVENMHDAKTFFCSELIGACYKVLGLLPREICCAQYWPGTFSTDSELKLLEGAALEDELQIEFPTKAPRPSTQFVL